MEPTMDNNEKIAPARTSLRFLTYLAIPSIVLQVLVSVGISLYAPYRTFALGCRGACQWL